MNFREINKNYKKEVKVYIGQNKKVQDPLVAFLKKEGEDN